MSTPDEQTLGVVLEEIRAVADELDEIKRDVKLALEHGEDIEQLQADIVRIDAHLATIDKFMEGPPALMEQLLALEAKQTREHGESVDATALAARLAGVAGDIEHSDVIDRHISASEERTEVKIQSVHILLKDLRVAIEENSKVILWIVVIAALTLAVVINIGWKVIAG